MNFFLQAGVYIPLLPAILAAIKWKSLNTSQKWFGIMLFAVSINSLLGRLWSLTGHSNNLPFFHVYILLEFVFLSIVYRFILSGFIKPLMLYAATVCFILLWLFGGTIDKGFAAYPTYIHALEALVLIAMSIGYFAKLLREKTVLRPARTFEFWISTGILMFFSGNLLLFAFSNFISYQSREVFVAIWGVHSVLAILLFSIYTVALIWAAKTPKSF